MTSADGQPRSEAFADGEREALDAWVVPGAPPGLVERVLARRRPKRWPYALAAVVLLSLGLGWWLLRGEPVRGVARADARMEQALAERGVAVLEPGAALSWQIDGVKGDAVIEQSAGAVFYRVEPGGAFVVKVPEGEVRVRGTCFSVEVEMGKVATGLSSGAVGAAVAALVTVSVYEGRVEVARGADVRVVEPGQQARLAEGVTVATREVGPAPTATSTPRVASADQQVAVPAAATRVPSTDVAAPPEVVALRDENKALKSRVGLLEAKAKELDLMREGTRAYGLSQQQLDRMAEECELRWDTVPLRASGPPEMRPADLALLGLGPSEETAINAAIAAEHDLVVGTLRAAYVELTGDDMANVLAIAPEALLSEIMDKTTRPEVSRLYGLLSRERADHAPDVPPEQLAKLGPTERVLRVLTTSGDRVEAALAKVLGPERARDARDVHGGFGHVSRSSNGCGE